MALGEVGSVTSKMMTRTCPSGSRLLKTIFKSHNFYVVFLENLRHQKVILKLTDLYVRHCL